MKSQLNTIYTTANKVLHGVVEIREGELRKTLLMAFFFFLVIFAITVVKPVRNSLFLSEFGVSKLPYMYIATAAFTGILVLIDSKLSTFLNRTAFMTTTLGFLLLNLVIFWWLVKLPDRWVPAVFYIWIIFFNYLLVAHFWSFANEFFNPREGKRLFGFILAVGTLGGIAGGMTANLSVTHFFSTEDVLLIAAFTLLASIAVVQLIARLAPNKGSVKGISPPVTKKKSEAETSTDWRFYYRHLRQLGVMVILAVIVSTLIDYQFNVMVGSTFSTKMAKTEFFGKFFAILNVISLLLQFFLTSRILKKYGIGVALILMPLILSLGSAGFMLFPTLLLASFLKITDKTLHYSLVQSARELLFLPVPSQIRVKAKLFIDIFVNRFAGAAAGCLILIFPMSVEKLSIIALIVLVAWMATTATLRKEYITSIKRLLIRRDVDIEERVIETLDAETVKTLIKGLNSKDSQKVLYSLSLLELVPSGEIEESLMRLLNHSDAQIRAQSLRILFNSGRSEMVRAIMPLMSDDSIEVRSEAIHFVWAYCKTCPDDRISEFLVDPDPRIKGAMLASMINHTGKLTREGMTVLDKMLTDNSGNGENHRMEAARVLGIVDGRFGLHKKLTPLLNDASITVQQVAIDSAGKALHNEFIATLIKKLGHPRLRKYARGALANYGNKILPLLKKVLADKETSLQIKKNIPQVFYRIQTEESWEELIENLDQYNTTIRYEVIKALNNIVKSCPDWELDSEKIRDVLLGEIRDYYWKLNVFHVYGRRERGALDVRDVDDILYVALQEKLDEGLDRIFRILALLYSHKEINNAYYFLTQGDTEEQANALEYLDNILPGDLMIPLLPIIDDIPLNHKIRQGRTLFNLQKFTRDDALLALLQDGDLWLEVCTVYSLGRERIHGFEAKVRKRLNSSELMLRETAERYFKLIE
ncbi:MAG: Npt1/Npt2 family nucleotide transporter [bacterium]